MSQRLRRIQKEITDCQRDQASLIDLQLVEEGNLMHMKGRFPGPPDSPYEGGVFQVDVVLPETYPFQPPKVKFDTKVYHPNVSSQTGMICLDILKEQWSPVLTISATLLSVQSLLCTPAPDDPQDAQVASQFLNDKPAFLETARFWTECYAKPREGDLVTEHYYSKAARGQKPTVVPEPVLSAEELAKRQKVQELVEMGFRADQVQTVLIRCNWKSDAAVEELLSNS